jgi:thioredoxin-like negative regulator of GroEL
MAPIVDGLEEEYGRRVAFQRLNVDEHNGRLAAQTYRVRGHPAIVMLDARGKVVWSRVGVQSVEDVASALDSALSSQNQ